MNWWHLTCVRSSHPPEPREQTGGGAFKLGTGHPLEWWTGEGSDWGKKSQAEDGVARGKRCSWELVIEESVAALTSREGFAHPLSVAKSAVTKDFISMGRGKGAGGFSRGRLTKGL